jgi:hypothetical protein
MSRKQPTTRVSTVVLVGLNAALIVIIAIALQKERFSTGSESAALNFSVEGSSEAEKNEITFYSLNAFDIISSRPLFVTSRRPPNLPMPEPEPFRVELIGIYLNDEKRAALIKMNDQEQMLWIREGEFISSWQVAQIDANRVLLRRVDETKLLYLRPET